MAWRNYAHVPPLLRLCSRACEPKLLKPATACGSQQEKPLQWEALLPQLENGPRLNKDQAQPEINKHTKLFSNINTQKNYKKDLHNPGNHTVWSLT